METYFVDKKGFKIDRERFFRRNAIEDQETRKKVEEMIQAAEKLGEPQGIYKEMTLEEVEKGVLLDGILFESELLKKNLAGQEKVYAFICTAGIKLENWANEKEEVVENYFADEIADETRRVVMEDLFQEVDEKFGLLNASIMTPGSLGAWPIKEQAKMFQLFEGQEKKIGVKLTENMLMIPRKSISGIRFAASKEFISCRSCPKHNCPSRKAPYQEDDH